MTYDNSNSGALFRNEKKQEGDKLPDYRGNAEVNGQQWDIAGWVKTAKKTGKKFLSIKFSPPYQGSKKPDPGAFVPPPNKSTETEEYDDSKPPF